VPDNVADPDPSAGPQHPGDLSENGVLVGREHDDAVGHHDVNGFVVERKVLDRAVEELDVRRANSGGVTAGQLDHLDGGVDPVDVAGRPDPTSRQHHIEAAARAEVEHRVTLPQLGDRNGVAVAEAQRGPGTSSTSS